MAVYKAIYYCRMCGAHFARTTADYDVVLTEAIFKKESGAGAHMCPDGSVGFAEFLGLRKEDTIERED